MRAELIIVSLLLMFFMPSILPSASAGDVSFVRSYGGFSSDVAFDIFVDSEGIYTVGGTSSFGPNVPNAFLTIFNIDNNHRCSIALDLGLKDEAIAVAVHQDRVYMLGNIFGIDPPNYFIAVFDKQCSLQALRIFNISVNVEIKDLVIEPGNPPLLYIAGGSLNGAYIAKLDSELNIIWAQLFTLHGFKDVAEAVYFSNGRIYVAGSSFDGKSWNMFISVFDSEGKHIATRELINLRSGVAFDIVVLGEDIYLTGSIDYPDRYDEVILVKLDLSLTVQWARAFGTQLGHEVAYGLAAAGPIIYIAGYTAYLDYVIPGILLVGFTPEGNFLHAFVITGIPPSGVDKAFSATSFGECVYLAGGHLSWPLYYVIFNGQVNPLTITLNTLTPSINQASPLPITLSWNITSYKPEIDTPPSFTYDAFYAKFCPATFISTTTVTLTETKTITLTSVTETTKTITTTTASVITRTATVTTRTTETLTATMTMTTTAYEIINTTIIQIVPMTHLVNQTIFMTIPTTITNTRTFFTTVILTSMTEVAITRWITATQSTTQTSTAFITMTSTETLPTYALPTILLLIALVLTVAVLMKRRRRIQL